MALLGLDLERLLFKTPRVLWHLVFWVVFMSFFALVYGSFEEDYSRQFQIMLTDALVQAPAVYIALYVLMPKYLFKERYFEFFILLILLILFLLI